MVCAWPMVWQEWEMEWLDFTVGMEVLGSAAAQLIRLLVGCREVTTVTVFITISCPPVALLASPSLVQVV